MRDGQETQDSGGGTGKVVGEGSCGTNLIRVDVHQGTCPRPNSGTR